MKKISLLFLLSAAALVLPASAISSKRVESAQKRAAADGKLLAFVVEQDYYNPNCPKCITSVNANNKQIARITPRKNVIVIKLEKDDLKEGDVPDCVIKAGGLPRIVITDAGGTKAIDVMDVKADKKRVEEMEEKISSELNG
jgi:hypothetical protein